MSPSPTLVKQAPAALAKVRAGDSELHELWAEAGDAPNEWLEVLAEVEASSALDTADPPLDTYRSALLQVPGVIAHSG